MRYWTRDYRLYTITDSANLSKADQRLQREASSIEIALEKVARPPRLFLTYSYHQRRGSHPVSTRSVLTFKTCTHAPHGRRCKVLTWPLAGKPDMDTTHAQARGCYKNGAHCSALAASQESTGGGCSRDSRIAIDSYVGTAKDGPSQSPSRFSVGCRRVVVLTLRFA